MSRDLLYEKLIRPILFLLDPESVHYIAVAALMAGKSLLPNLGLTYEKDDLRTDLFGTILDNPIGLAAGFDKNAAFVPLLGSLGFGFAELGSVCARPHGGNLRPRLFRLPADKALINRMGLNGLGAEVVAANLARIDLSRCLTIAVNIAKTNDAGIKGEQALQDIVYSFTRLKDLPVKYVTLNTSCPNTAEGCLKESAELAKVLEQIDLLNSKKLPLLLKLSPDSSSEFVEELVSLSIKHKIAGFVCGNTTLRRDGLHTNAARLGTIAGGGLSGKPLKPLNLALTRKIAGLKQPGQIIIGVGGIECGEDIFDYLSAGAHVVQIYTGFIYRGPAAVKAMCEELSQILKSKKTSLQQLRDNSISI